MLPAQVRLPGALLYNDNSERADCMIKGAIFDFDGTLFDSMFIWEQAGEMYLRAVGKTPEEDLKSALKPMSLRQSAEYLKERYALPMSAAEIMDGINRTVEEFYFHTVLPKPGAPELLAELSRRGVRMCIATATDRYQAEAALERCGLRRYFSEIFTCTEIGSGKDDPLIFRRAMEHLGTDRESTLVFEDAWHAICTAKGDGFMVAAVYDPHEDMQSSIRNIADVYLTDFSDLHLLWKRIAEG